LRCAAGAAPESSVPAPAFKVRGGPIIAAAALILALWLLANSTLREAVTASDCCRGWNNYLRELSALSRAGLELVDADFSEHPIKINPKNPREAPFQLESHSPKDGDNGYTMLNREPDYRASNRPRLRHSDWREPLGYW